VLLVSVREDAHRITGHFDRSGSIRTEQVPAGSGQPRTVRFITLEGYRGR
jgi:hypothetical protein